MTILDAAQQAIMRLVGQRPNAVVSSTDDICVEVTSIAQEAATDIMKAHDWQHLTEFHDVLGDGTATAFPFPEDYDRMVQKTGIYDPSIWCWGYTHVTDYGEWLKVQGSGFNVLAPGIWTIRKSQFHFMPAPASSDRATFVYISNAIFTDADGQPKAKITQDTDVFVLSDRLLTLGIIWRWLALKRMDYQQEIDDYNTALSQEMARDKGARVVRKSSPRRIRNVGVAWPYELG